MEGFYAYGKIFSSNEILLWQKATELVGLIDISMRPKLRCHELAYAIGLVLDLQPQDGKYGLVEHSWLWTSKPGPEVNIIDVYTPGSLPQVQLIHYNCVVIPNFKNYVSGNERTDINKEIISNLINTFRKVL